MVAPRTLAEVAEELRYTGRDRERSVRRLFARHGVAITRRDRATYLVRDEQLAALYEAMICSRSEGAAPNSTSAVRSESVARPASSKSTLRGVIAGKMPKRTGRALRRKPAMKCFTVLEGGRNA